MGNQATQRMAPRQQMSWQRKLVIGGGISVGLVLFLFIIFKLAGTSGASAASSGEESPSSAATSGGSGRKWNNESNVYSSNGSDAYVSLSSSGGGRNSEYLEVTNFGFNLPATATVTGVEAVIEMAASSSSSVYDRDIYLTKDGSSSVGNDQATSTYLLNYDSDYTYGGSSNLWGTTLSYSEVNSSNFGIRIRLRNGASGSRYGYIDHVTLNVHYTIGSVEAPGGVSSNVSLWLDANEGVTGTTQISAWSDQSGNGNDASMSTSTYRPNLETDLINFNDAVHFDGGDEYMQGNAGGYTDEMFVVLVPDAIVNSSAASQVPFTTTSVNSTAVTYIGLGTSTGAFSNEILTYGVGGSTTWRRAHTSSSDSYASGDPMILNVSNDDGSSATTIYHNQTQVMNNSNGSYQTADNDEAYRIGGNCYVWGNSYYNGKLAEVITYSGDLSSADRTKVASYLAMKYGITIDDDYVLSDGTTVWSQSGNSGYHNNVTAIARDDDSNLDQQKSVSQHTGAIFTMDKGGAFGSDLDAIIWGHNAGALTQGSSNGSSNYPMASNRTWKVELNGTPGTVSIDIDLSALGMDGGAASDYALLIDQDGNFTGSASEHTAGASLNGTTLTFTGVSFTDGYYVTVAERSITAVPGGVDTDLAMWLKANGDVYEDDLASDAAEFDDAVKVWDDASDNGYDVSSVGSTGTEPALKQNGMNYNPSIKFDDNGNRHLASSINNISDDMSWFVVYKSRQSVSSGSFWQNPALVGGENSGSANDYTLSLNGGKPFFKGTAGDNFGAASATAYNNGIPALVSSSRVKASSGTNYIYVNGTQEASYATDNNSLSDPSTVGIGNHDDPGSTSQFDGHIAEVIGYEGVLSENDRHQVETYLAIKYGMTVDHDYVNSSGTTIWDQSSNSTFHNRVTAIMRDDASGLDQRQSMSVDGGIVAIGNADIVGSNADNSNSFSGDGAYVIFGDDDDDIFGTYETDYGTTTNSEVIDRRVARTWYLEEGGSVGTLEITFMLTDFPGVKANASTYDFTELRLLVDGDGVFATGSQSISPTSYTYNAGDTSITFHHDFSSGGTYFSLATLDEAGSPLPVEFSYFDATPTEDGTVELSWGTATETNNDYFEIERSQDGIFWESIATIDGAGTSIVGIDYLEYDYQPFYGTSFYRIKQVDFDGTTDYSDRRQVEVGTETQGVLEVKSVYPNPFSSFITLDVSFPSGGEAQLQLLNSNGSVLQQTSVQVFGGLNTLRMENLDGVSTGYYLLRVVKDDLQVSERVLKR